MKKTVSLLLFCVLCFCACGTEKNEQGADIQQTEDVVEVEYERTSKDDAKDLAVQAKEEYEQNRNFEKAIELFEKAVELDTEEEWIYTDMARVRMEIRDYDGAIEDLKKAKEIKEKNNIEKQLK